MIQHILAATDGSDSAGKAVDLAAEVAAKFDAELTVVHVIVHGHQAEEMEHMAEAEHVVSQASPALPNISAITGAMSNLFTVERSGEEMARRWSGFCHAPVNRAVERAKKIGARPVSGKAVIGDYANAIVKTANESGADLIFLGSRGLGSVKELLQGSVSHAVTQRANCSVVTVR